MIFHMILLTKSHRKPYSFAVSYYLLSNAVRIELDEPKSLERLFRYCARPPFSGGIS